jgi:hypothetical protein
MEPEHHHDHIVVIIGILMVIGGLFAWMLTIPDLVSLDALVIGVTGLMITLISMNQIEMRKEARNTRDALIKEIRRET